MKRNWLVVVLALLVLGIVAIPRLVIVPRVIQVIEAELNKEFDLANVKIQMKAPLGWELLLGRIPQLMVEVENIEIDGLIVAHTIINGKNIFFDIRSLRQRNEYVFKGADFLVAHLTVKESDLNNFFWHEIDPNEFLQIRIATDDISLEGKIPIFGGLQVGVSVHGYLDIIDGSYLRFVPKDIEVRDTKLPSSLLEVVKDNYDLKLDLGLLSYPLKISQIILLEREMQIKMEVVQ